MSSNPCIYVDYGGGDNLGRLGLRAAVWWQAESKKTAYFNAISFLIAVNFCTSQVIL